MANINNASRLRRFLLLRRSSATFVKWCFIIVVLSHVLIQLQLFLSLHRQDFSESQHVKEEFNPASRFNGVIPSSKSVRHPTVIIIGTQKGGTTALWSYLSAHPQMAPPRTIESHFFDRIPPEKQTLERYLGKYFNMSLILKSRHLRSFEKTPVYMFDPKVARRVAALVPWVKVIALLRHPVERAYSHYKMVARAHVVSKSRGEKKPFGNFGECVRTDLDLLGLAGVVEQFDRWKSRKTGEEGVSSLLVLEKSDAAARELFAAWEKYYDMLDEVDIERGCGGIVGRGMYAIQLPYYFDAFRNDARLWKERFLILKSEDMRMDGRSGSDNIDYLRTVTNFIDIQSFKNVTQITNEDVGSKGISATRAAPVVGTDEVEKTRETLRRFYEPFNKLLLPLLGDEWEHPWE